MEVCILAVDFFIVFVDALFDVLDAVFNLSDFFAALALLNMKLLCEGLLSDNFLLKLDCFCCLLVYLFLKGFNLVCVFVESVVNLLDFFFCGKSFFVCFFKSLLVLAKLCWLPSV